MLATDLSTVLVTGATGGIGRALCRRLLVNGFVVVATGRDKQKLEKLQEATRHEKLPLYIMPAELTSPLSRVDLLDYCQKTIGGIDVLINNAGFGWYGHFEQMDPKDIASMLQTNIEAATQLSRQVLPAMLQRKRGHIINIGSVGGDIPSQGIAIYAGTKAYLSAFSTSLHRELKGSGVLTTIVKPGPVSTGFFENAKRIANGKVVPAQKFSVSPDLVANRIVRIIGKPRRIVYIPFYLGLTPWIELGFGWLMDAIGPLLLKSNP